MKSKEERFVELIEGHHIETFSNDFINYNIFNKKGEWIIEHNKYLNWIPVCEKNIWSVFEQEYNMEYNDIQFLIKNMLQKYFNIFGMEPEASDRYYFD